MATSGMEAATAFCGRVPGFAIVRVVSFLHGWNVTMSGVPPSSRWKRLVMKWYHRRKLASFWGALGCYLKKVPKGKLRNIVRRLDVNRERGWARLVVAYRTVDILRGVFGLLGNALKLRPHRRLRGPARRLAITRILQRDSI